MWDKYFCQLLWVVIMKLLHLCCVVGLELDSLSITPSLVLVAVDTVLSLNTQV